MASMIKFGYKDYLMLFVFISVCANDEAVLGRMGDVIQMNIQNVTRIADEGTDVKEQLKAASTIEYKSVAGY